MLKIAKLTERNSNVKRVPSDVVSTIVVVCVVIKGKNVGHKVLLKMSAWISNCLDIYLRLSPVPRKKENELHVHFGKLLSGVYCLVQKVVKIIFYTYVS